MEMLQGVWKQHLRPRAFVGYGLKIFLPSPPNYVTRSPGLDPTADCSDIIEYKDVYDINVFILSVNSGV